MADIAERAPAGMPRMARVARLAGIVEILKIPPALEIDEPVDARGHLLPFLIADVERAPVCAADRPRPLEPLLGGSAGRSAERRVGNACGHTGRSRGGPW